jgi:hypothetical protein
LQRIALFQQRRDAKIREGLASFGIESIDSLDDATAFGLAAILHGMEKRDLRKETNSKSTPSSTRGSSTHGPRTAQPHVATPPPTLPSHRPNPAVNSSVASVDNMGNVEGRMRSQAAAGSDFAYDADSSLRSIGVQRQNAMQKINAPTASADVIAAASADVIAAASADGRTSLDCDRVPNVPLLEASQDEANLSFSSSGGSWNSDVSKGSELKTRRDFIDGEGGDGLNAQSEDKIAAPASLAGRSVLAPANVKNGLAAFGIEDFDGLDDSIKFGLSAIMMGMKTHDRQRQAASQLQSTNNRALRKSPLAVESDDKGRVRVVSEYKAASSSPALNSDSSLRLKASTRNPREKVASAQPASAAAQSRRRDMFTASPAISDGNQNSPYLQSSGGKAERELNIPSFDFHKAAGNRRAVLEAGYASSNSFDHVAAPVSKTDAPMRLEGPRSGPFIAWNDQAERFDDSDIEAIFGSDDVSAAGLRAIMRGSSSSMPRKLAQLGRRNTRE